MTYLQLLTELDGVTGAVPGVLGVFPPGVTPGVWADLDLLE